MSNQSLGPLSIRSLDVGEINRALQEIQERIDKIAGLRGTTTAHGDMTINGNLVINGSLSTGGGTQ